MCLCEGVSVKLTPVPLDMYVYIYSICYDIFYCYILLHVVTAPPHPYIFISPYPIPPTLCVFVCFYICYIQSFTTVFHIAWSVI